MYLINEFLKYSFQVNHPIRIVRLGFYGPGMPEDSCHETNYTVKLSFSCPENIIFLQFETLVVVEPNQKIFYVDLSSPIDVMPDIDYTVSFILVVSVPMYFFRKIIKIYKN